MRQKADDARRGSTDGRQEKSVKLPRRMSASVAKQETRWGMSKETRSGLKVTALWITYLLLGSVAFIYLEQTSTTTATPKDHHHWARFKGKDTAFVRGLRVDGGPLGSPGRTAGSASYRRSRSLVVVQRLSGPDRHLSEAPRVIGRRKGR